MINGYIYRIKNNANGMVYIGSTVEPKKRLRRHRSSLASGDHTNAPLQADWLKYGEQSFEFQLVLSAVFENIPALLIEEEKHIGFYLPEYVYNIAHPLKPNHYKRKFSSEEVREIFKLAAGGLTQQQIFEKYNRRVNISSINNILTRKNYRDVAVDPQLLNSVKRTAAKSAYRKLEDGQVVSIFKLLNQGATQKDIAGALGISAGTLGRIVRRETYRDVDIDSRYLSKKILDKQPDPR